MLDVVARHAVADGRSAIRRRRSGVWAEMAAMMAARSGSRPAMAISSKPVRPVSSEASAFLQALFMDGAADGHGLAHRLSSRCVSVRLGAGEFLERETRDLGHDIVDRRLERRGRDLGDVVVQDFVQRIADRELCGDLARSGIPSLSTRVPTSATRAGSSRSPPCGRPLWG